MEIIVPLRHGGDFPSCWKNFHDRKWDKLCDPESKLNLEIVREFNVNAMPSNDGHFEFKTWVRGKEISFSRSKINQYLALPSTFADDELYEYHDILARKAWEFEYAKNKLCLSGHSYELTIGGRPQKFLRSSLKTKAQFLMEVVLYNIRPHSHTSSIPVEICGLLACILEGNTVDVGRLIANELKKVSLSGTSLGDRTSCQLSYPGLIMGLRKKSQVTIPSVGHQVIKGVIDDTFIAMYCVLRYETPAVPVVPVVAAPPSGFEYSWDMHEVHQ
ncbi:hypothetical protein RYX36_021129 [Vicia faba]